MKTESIDLYAFKELPANVQAKLVTKRAENNGKWLDSNEIKDYMIAEVTNKDHEGPNNPIILTPELFELGEMNFSLGYCQGDGVRMTGKFDQKRLINMYMTGRVISNEDAEILELLKDEIRVRITPNRYSNYVHNRTIDVDSDGLYIYNEDLFVNDLLRARGIDPDEWDEIDGANERQALKDKANRLAEEVGEFGLELVRDACDQAERLGYEFIEDASSEERAREELEDDAEEKYMVDGREY